jgi:hypothetical protein
MPLPLATIRMKFTIIYIAVILLLISCRSKNSSVLISEIDTLNSSEILEGEFQLCIDIVKFKKQADSIISIILGHNTVFSQMTDTIKPDNASNDEEPTSIPQYIALHSIELFHHRFILGSPNKGLSINLYEGYFRESKTTDTVFEYLKYLANNDDVNAQPEFNAPGLTYENDYLIKQKKSLIWLNSKCLYSFQNNMKYANAIEKSLMDNSILDRIVCRCGHVNCK